MTGLPALGYRVRMSTAAVVIGLMVILLSIGIGGLLRAILTPAFPVKVSNRPGRPVVLEVLPDYGGDARELRPGDVITRIEGQGVEDLYYALANVYLSPWFGARTLAGLGFGPQMTGVDSYINAHPKDFGDDEKARVLDILERKRARYAVKGNAWQNVFPTHMRDYQDWWARLQAA